MSTTFSDTRTTRPLPRFQRAQLELRAQPSYALLAVLGLAALVFIGGLGRSTFFIDEVYSYNVAAAPLSGVMDGIRATEVTPPLYYYLLHGWMAFTGADSEAALRLPSALAGVALVGATAWLGTLVAGRRAGLLAGLFTALSPLTLQYAQEVRSYIWVMLAATVAVAAAVHWSKRPHQARWILIAAVASVAAAGFNYIGGFVTGPLALWLMFRRDLPLWGRLLTVGAAAAPLLAVFPLLSEQMGAGHRSDDSWARITNIGLVKLAGTPYDGRGTFGGVLALQLGTLATVDAVALLARAEALRHVYARKLIAGLAAGPVIFVMLVSAIVHPAAITRYTVVAAPFMLVALGVAVAIGPRLVGRIVGALALVASVIGITATLFPSGQFPPARDAIRVAGEKWRSGDALVQLDGFGYQGSMQYYTERLLPKGAPDGVAAGDLTTALEMPQVRGVVRDRGRLWLMSAPPMWMPGVHRMLADLGYKVGGQWRFKGQTDVNLVLAERR